ncbi:MAG: hypothetical protein AAFY99_04660 [Pseudomonadota bacterium]
MSDFSTLSTVLLVSALASGPFYMFATYYFAGVGVRHASIMTIGLFVFAAATLWFIFFGQYLSSNPLVMPAFMLTCLAIPPLLVLAFPRFIVPDGIDLGWLIGVQAFRVVGGLYLIEHFRGNVGSEFAYWAGVGDVITGLLACALLVQYWVTGSMSLRLAFWTIIFGLADFAWAYGIGVLSFPTPIQIFAIGETHATNLFPIALIPFLLAPIAMGYMVMTLIVLRRQSRSDQAER